MGEHQSFDHLQHAFVFAADQHQAAAIMLFDQSAHELDAIHVRHVQIEQDQVGCIHRDCHRGEGGKAVGARRYGRVTQTGKHVREQSEYERLVVKQQDARTGMNHLNCSGGRPRDVHHWSSGRRQGRRPPHRTPARTSAPALPSVRCCHCVLPIRSWRTPHRARVPRWHVPKTSTCVLHRWPAGPGRHCMRRPVRRRSHWLCARIRQESRGRLPDHCRWHARAP